MTDIAPAAQGRWTPLSPTLNAATKTWVTELRSMFDTTGLSVRAHPA
ncbi:hypothetical protein [Actinomadura macra]|nr:hypothetical protein [Actinomadura macra]